MARPRTRYNGLTDEELADALNLWFIRHGASRDVWCRTATGKLIKRAMLTLGAFKHRPRGNAAKGYRVMRERLAEREARRSA